MSHGESPGEPGPNAADPRGRRGPSNWLVASASGLVVAVALGAGWATWTLLQQQHEVDALRAEVAELREEVARAETELERVEARVGSSDEAPGGGLDGLLDDLLDQGLGDLGELGGLPEDPACFQPPGEVTLPDVPDGPVDEQVDVIAEAVETLRGHTFDDDPPVEFLPGEEFAEAIEEAIAEGYPAERAEVDAARLSRLGAIPPDTDLRELQQELVSDQAAGFYRPDSGDVVVRGDGDGSLTATEQVILAHELEHALADEQVGLPAIGEDAADRDQAQAHLAVTEGGAVLVQNWFTMAALDIDDQLSLGADPDVAASRETLAQFPHVLQRSLMFPYEDGFAFVCAAHQDGGWEAVDALLGDPPAATAAILFPDRLGEEPAEPADLSPPDGWETVETAPFGAAELLFLLEAPGDDPEAALEDPRGRVAALDGGTIATLQRDEQTAVSVSLAQRDGEADLCETMTGWHEAAFDAAAATTEGDEALAAESGDHGGVVACTDDTVRVGLGPDLETARAVSR